jgi:hypothetical protein
MHAQPSRNASPKATKILDSQVIRIKRGRLTRFGFEPAWNAYFDFYLSSKYLERPILKLEDITFHLFLRKNLNDNDPNWHMPSFRMMKRRLGVSQDRIEGILERLTKAQLLKRISGKQQGEKGANVANTYVLSDPIQNLEEFLTVAAAGELPQSLRDEWTESFATPVPEFGTAPRTGNRYSPVPVAGTHKHTSRKQTSTTNSVVDDLVQLRIGHGKAQELVSQFSAELVEEKIDLLKWKLKLQEQGHSRGRPVEDPAAWLIRAIENDYQSPPGFKTSAQRERETAKREKEAAKLVRQDTERLKRQRKQRERGRERLIERLAELKKEHGAGEREREIWHAVVRELKTRERNATRPARAMLESSALLNVRDGQALIVLRNSFARRWVEKRLAHTLERLLARQIRKREVTVKMISLDQAQRTDTSPH